MMEEDTSAGGDVEQAVPSPDPQKHPTDDPNKKWKVLSLSTFLVVVIVLSIALGTTLGGSGGMDTTPSNNGVNPEQEGELDAIIHPSTQPPSGPQPATAMPVVATTVQPSSPPSDVQSVQPTSQPTPQPSPALSTTQPLTNDVTAPLIDVTDTTTNPTEDKGATTPDKDETIAPQVFKAQFLESKGPILTKPVRVIDPTVANGYESCDDLREDMLNALKFYANSVILREMNNDW